MKWYELEETQEKADYIAKNVLNLLHKEDFAPEFVGTETNKVFKSRHITPVCVYLPCIDTGRGNKFIDAFLSAKDAWDCAGKATKMIRGCCPYVPTATGVKYGVILLKGNEQVDSLGKRIVY